MGANEGEEAGDGKGWDAAENEVGAVEGGGPEEGGGRRKSSVVCR